MPEYPDITVYNEAIEARAVGNPLAGLRLSSPFLLRSVEPPLSAFVGRPLVGMRRLGKRLVFSFDDELFLVLHLMIAGRLHWKPLGHKLTAKQQLAAFDFEAGAHDAGTLLLTEAGTKKRASLYAVRGEAGLSAHDPGGLEVFDIDEERFKAQLRAHNHTMKRVLTDPRIFSGIGNAYSDEILHRAQLSPVTLSTKLDDEDVARLFSATRAILSEWTERLRGEAEHDFPAKVTAFRDDFAVHGKYKQPCPRCGDPVQRIAYASNETNYCARCQTGGRLLADRALSRLMKKDWPRSLDELERLQASHRGRA